MSGEEETTDRQEDVTAWVQAVELIQHRLDASCTEKIHAHPTLKLLGCWEGEMVPSATLHRGPLGLCSPGPAWGWDHQAL